MRMPGVGLLGVLLGVGVVAVTLGYKSRTESRYRNFRVVEPGVLYRSGQLDPEALDRVIQEYNIRTVITFRGPRREGEPQPDAAEEEYCRARGLGYYRLQPRRWGSLSGGPPPIEENIREFVRIIEERRPYGPILIHCFAGVHRTGAYTAIYRMEFNKWSNSEALAEMQELGYTTLEDDPDILEYLRSYVPGRIGTRVMQ